MAESNPADVQRRAISREKSERFRDNNPRYNYAAVKKWRQENPEKYAAQKARKTAYRSPEKRHAAYLRLKYKLTPEQRDAMLADQGGGCAGCGTTQPGAKGWHVDHCHKNGHVRGILCGPCNTALGLVKDNPDTLKRLIEYLAKDPTT